MVEDGAIFEKKVMDIIRSQDSVYAVYPMDREVCGKVAADEVSAAYDGKVIDNDAVRRILSKKRRYCVFSKGFLQPSTERIVVWVDQNNEMCGHSVPRGFASTVPDNAAWVTDSFVVYTENIIDDPLTTMAFWYPLAFLGDNGVDGAIAYNTRLTTNGYLRSRFGFDGPSTATVTIVAVD